MSRQALPEGRWASDREWLTTCPECGKEKLYWNVAVKKGFCQRCKMAIHGERRFRELFQVVSYHVKPTDVGGYEHIPSNAVPAYLDRRAKEYLYGRYLTDEDVIQTGVYYADGTLYCPIDPIIPNKPRAWTKRDIKGSGGWVVMKGVEKKYYAFGFGKAVERIGSGGEGRCLAICEGIFDAVPERLGIPTIAVLGSHIPRVLLYALEPLNLSCVYGAFDYDDAGRGATKACERALLRGLGIRFKDVGYPDKAVDYGDLGPSHKFFDQVRREIAVDQMVYITEELGLYEHS